MTRGIFLSAVCLAAVASGHRCEDLTVEVDISARNGVFDLETPKTNIDVTNFILDLSRQGSNYSDSILTGYQTRSGKFELQGTFCEPEYGYSRVLQILTHGVGFDRSYWNLPFNNYNYSYSKVAADDYGFSTFSYDRLGLGESSRGDPISEIQSWLELAALRTLTNKLRQGKVPELANKSFDKFVHVGHSFGSILSYSLTAEDPTISDGVILTGFSHSTDSMSSFLLGGAFVQANTLKPLAKYADGYIAPGLETAVQTNFFAPGMFDPKLLTLGFKKGQPATIGEFLTLGTGAGNVNSFAGPVLVITGDRDVPFCGGDCSATGDSGLESLLQISAALLKKASPFETYVVPGAGHGLGLEYSHVETTGKILDFLTQNGLAGR